MAVRIRAPSSSASLRSTRAPRSVVVPQAMLSTRQHAAAAAAAIALSGFLAAGPAMAGVQLQGVANGATVSSPVHLDFAVEGMAVKPAAAGLEPGVSGHHHLLVDLGAPAKGEAIPFDAQHLHFGKGQTSADVELAPGKHTLTLQFADAAHVSYGKEWSSTITVNVK